MMRFTGLVAITIVLLGCTSAFAVPAPTILGFLSSDMSFQYCDYEEFKSGGFLAAGYDNNSACGFDDGVMIGVQASFPPSELPVVGPVFVFANADEDAYCDCFTGDQFLLVTKTVPYDIHAPHFGWEGLLNTYDAFYAYLLDWGYLTSWPPPTGPDAKSGGKGSPKAIGQNTSHEHNVMGQ